MNRRRGDRPDLWALVGLFLLLAVTTATVLLSSAPSHP
jgi:hypothetical protein